MNAEQCKVAADLAATTGNDLFGSGWVAGFVAYHTGEPRDAMEDRLAAAPAEYRDGAVAAWVSEADDESVKDTGLLHDDCE